MLSPSWGKDSEINHFNHLDFGVKNILWKVTALLNCSTVLYLYHGWDLTYNLLNPVHKFDLLDSEQ